MLSQETTTDLREIILGNSPFGPKDVENIINVLSNDTARQYEGFRDGIDELASRDDLSPAMMLKLGVCQYIIGRYQDALKTLAGSDGGGMAQFYKAKAYAALKEYDKALEFYELAKPCYYPDVCALGIAEVYLAKDDPKGSLQQLDKLSGAVEQTADYLYLRGATVAAIGGNPAEAIALYERAQVVDPNHAGALFGLGLENERRGNDKEALNYYKRASVRYPSHIGVLMNLGLLYEDLDESASAVECFQRILDADPTNKRARLFLKDSRESSKMHYDEGAQRKRDNDTRILSTSINDFELSVRCRNCLKNLKIETLGDLVQHSEQELMENKNFGETSLKEIKTLLLEKGLRLGGAPVEKPAPGIVAERVEEVDTTDEQGITARSIDDLELSNRAAKCLHRKNILTVGDLLRYSAEDLLGSKNFGQQSLKDVQEKLKQLGLSLRGE